MQPDSPAPEHKTRWGELDSPKDHVCTAPAPPTLHSPEPLEGREGTCVRVKKLLECEILRCIVSILCQQCPII